MRASNGRLLRTWKPGHAAKLNAYLEDYANVADGLVALYEASFDQRWLDVAIELADAILTHFVDPNGGFFDTSSDHEQLIARPKDLFDNATPSGNAVAADVLLRLALLTGRAEYQRAAEGVLELLQQAMRRYPLGFARALSAADFLLSQPKEIAIIGPPGAPETQALVDAAFEPFWPNKVVAGGAPGAAPHLPLLEGREQRNGAMAYVCHGYVCQSPTTSPAELRRQLIS
jgi:uncharacterized protein YyaL (SSP411 family)